MQVWDLVWRLFGQLRVTMGGVTGLDLGVALAMADALGINRLVVAEWLPAIEQRMVRTLNVRRDS